MTKRMVYLNNTDTGEVKAIGWLDYDSAMGLVASYKASHDVTGLDLGDGTTFTISIQSRSVC